MTLANLSIIFSNFDTLIGVITGEPIRVKN